MTKMHPFPKDMDHDLNADWMHQLDGYQTEQQVHELAFGKTDDEDAKILKRFIIIKGGPGSGHYGHAGRPGKRGGSLPASIAMSIRTGKDAAERQAAAAGKQPTPETDPEENRKKVAAMFDTKDGKPWDHVSDKERSDQKQKVVDSLAEGADMYLHEANDFVKQWAYSSNDSDMRSLGIQRAAEEEFGDEFGVTLSDWQKSRIADVQQNGSANQNRGLISGKDGWKDIDSEVSRRALRHTYEQTQSQLRAAGIGPDDKVVLYRGISYKEGTLSAAATNRITTANFEGSRVAYSGNAIESWSFSKRVADNFSGATLNSDDYELQANMRIEIPAKFIYSTPRSGQGCWPEAEVITFGNVPGLEIAIEDLHVGKHFRASE